MIFSVHLLLVHCLVIVHAMRMFFCPSACLRDSVPACLRVLSVCVCLFVCLSVSACPCLSVGVSVCVLGAGAGVGAGAAKAAGPSSAPAADPEIIELLKEEQRARRRRAGVGARSLATVKRNKAEQLAVSSLSCVFWSPCVAAVWGYRCATWPGSLCLRFCVCLCLWRPPPLRAAGRGRRRDTTRRQEGGRLCQGC